MRPLGGITLSKEGQATSSQNVPLPVKPNRQAHMKEPLVFVQLAFGSHTPLFVALTTHSLISAGSRSTDITSTALHCQGQGYGTLCISNLHICTQPQKQLRSIQFS
eukprot:scpid108668/ scgid7866/ 